MAKKLLQMSWIQIICTFLINAFFLQIKQLATLSEDSETPIEGQICMTDEVIFDFS